jgi:8-oxo-dGTP pyrophosphatase MutT (NUDIX family)
MRFEKSCGSIIFRLEDSLPLFLVVRYKRHSKYWGLVKGHVENQETEQQTAKREIHEEVGFESVVFIPGFRETITYSPFKDCIKEVVFFLGYTQETKVRFLFDELDDSKWVTELESRLILKHGNDRFLVHQANSFLKSNPL